jgi:diguanylate cyclase (GGDEF)-like protein
MTDRKVGESSVDSSDDRRAITSDILKVSPLLKNASPEFVNKHLASCALLQYNENEVILCPELTNNCVYLVINGELAVRHGHENGELINMLGAGEIVGELSILDGQNPSSYVKTVCATLLLEISSETLWRMVDGSHDVARNLLHILVQRIRSGNESVASSLKLQEKHQREAQLDALTGLNNRRWIDDTLRDYYDEWLGHGTILSVIMIDIDNFKAFNDKYGHIAGDQVLKKVASAMKKNLRPNEIVSRFGGEEFIVMLPKVSVENAIMVAERLRAGVAGYFFQEENSGDRVLVTISLGVADSIATSTREELITNADQALYQAKNQGRNQAQVYQCKK